MNRKNRIGLTMLCIFLLVAGIAVFQSSLAKINRHSSRVTPELRELINVKTKLFVLGIALEAMTIEYRNTNSIAIVFETLSKTDYDAGRFTNDNNPFPDFLPAGTYGRLNSWKTNCTQNDVPILWRRYDWHQGVVVYLALSGKVNMVSNEEFANVLRNCKQ